MCDAESALDESQVFVGRTLRLNRVRELNDKTFFYQMLKDNPQLVNIRPGVEDDLLKGAIDSHIHASPDFVHRAQDMIDVAIDAARAGMRAVVFKDHYNVSANAAYITQRHIDHLFEGGALPARVEVYGGIGTCHGVDPEYVRVGLKYPNVKMIWFPTFTSYGFWRGAGRPDHDGIRLVDERGRVLPEVEEVMHMAADNGVGIGLGHTDYPELRPLAEKAAEIGVRTVLDHPLLELNRLLLEEMQELVRLGTFVGTYCQPMIPSLYQPVQDPFATVEVIQTIGAARCLVATDFGQVLNPKTLDGLRIFVRALLGFGISPDDVRRMLRDNPATLMGLDPEPSPASAADGTSPPSGAK